MRVLIDSTNPENGDKKLYLEIIEVPVGTAVEVNNCIAGIYHIWIEGIWDDLFEIKFTCTVDLEGLEEKLLRSAYDSGVREAYLNAIGEIHNDDLETIGIQQFLTEFAKITGCEAICYMYQ